jgi:5-methyltetrahydropteroyltriglutamate--homocysteine methyltransferase
MATTSTTNAYRADHIGSFLRPQSLLQLRAEKPNSPELREAEDREIRRILAKQFELGFDIFTDGEFRRESFMSDLVDAVDGFSTSDAHARDWKTSQGTGTQPLRDVVTQKISQKRRLTEYELTFLKKNSPGAIKMTLPSANQFPAIAYRKGASEKAYPTYAPFLADVAGIIAGEMAALAADGVAYIQVDAPRYSYYLDEKWRTFLRTEYSPDLDALLDEAIAVDNQGFHAARKPGVLRAIHLCRGNNRSNWYASGGYDAIAEKLFNQLDVDRFLLEYDDERSGTFEPLRFVPKDKIVVLGLVSTKVGKLEDADTLAKLIDQAAKYIPLDRLALSPQCGFASMSGGNVIDEAEQWAKMTLVAAVAKKVWGSTF